MNAIIKQLFVCLLLVIQIKSNKNINFYDRLYLALDIFKPLKYTFLTIKAFGNHIFITIILIYGLK